MLSWEVLEASLNEDVPARFPVVAGQEIEFLVGQTSSFLLLRIPYEGDSTLTPSPLIELAIERARLGDKDVIELTVFQRGLFSTFYAFSIEIVQLIVREKVSPPYAIDQALRNWKSLLGKRNTLDEPKQIGLLGELCFLKAVMAERGKKGFDAWTAPFGEPHDFKLSGVEIEVKSTLKSRRIHVIHGAAQLSPSEKMDLHILSLQFEPAGDEGEAAFSLNQMVEYSRNALAGSLDKLSLFDSHIAALGYADVDSNFYRKKYRFRTKPSLIKVDSNMPRITTSVLHDAIGEAPAVRIRYVEYEIDVEGMGCLEGSEEFKRVLPNLVFSGK